MDMDRNLKLALRTGKVYFGANQAARAVKDGEAKLIIKAKNTNDEMDMGTIPVKTYEGTSVELGSACGKPFSISYITVIDAGKSDLLR